MAKVTKPIYVNAITAAGDTTIYTAPAGGAIVNFIQLVNLGASVDTTYDIYRVEIGNVKADKYQVVKGQAIGQGSVLNETQQAPFGNWFLDESDFIVITVAGASLNLSVALNVVEG